MPVITPWALDALDGTPTYDARTLRMISTGSLGASSQPLTAASGVLSGLLVSADFPQVNVSPGLMVVSTSSGSYVTGLDSPAGLTLEPRSAQPRIDSVAFSVQDSGSARTARVALTTGEPADNPTAPSPPADAVVLAELLVPPTGPVEGTRVAGDTAARGGVVVVADEAARWRVDMSAPRTVLQLDTKSLWAFDGGTWWEAGSSPVFAYWSKHDSATVPNKTWYTVTGWSDVDTTGVGYSTGVWTVSRSGRYLINASVAFVPVSNPTGQRVHRILVNGEPVAQSPQLKPTSSHNSVTQSTVSRPLAAGDEVSVQVYQSQGSSMALLDENVSCNHVEIERLGG